MVEGLRRTFEDDAELLQHGMALFEAVYRGLQPTENRPRRAVARSSSTSQKTRKGFSR
jgi:hypothetical protein